VAFRNENGREKLNREEKLKLVRSLPQSIKNVLYFGDADSGEASFIDFRLPVSRVACKMRFSERYYKTDTFTYANASAEQRREYLGWLLILSDKWSKKDVEPVLTNEHYLSLFYRGLERKMLDGYGAEAFEWMAFLNQAFLGSEILNHMVEDVIFYSLATGDKTIAKKYGLILGAVEASSAFLRVLAQESLTVFDVLYYLKVPEIKKVQEKIKQLTQSDVIREKYLRVELNDIEHGNSDLFLYEKVQLEFYFRNDDSLTEKNFVEYTLINQSIRNRTVMVKALTENSEYVAVVKKVLDNVYDSMSKHFKRKPQVDFVSEVAVKEHKLRFDEILKLTNVQFTRVVWQVLDLNGYTNSSIEENKSGALDIVTQLNGQRFGLRCKKAIRKVGNRAVQEAYVGKKYYSCDEVVVITNSDFTEDARFLAVKLGVSLWNEGKLRELWEKGLERADS